LSPAGKRFRTLALTDNVPTLTAWANDTDYSEVFSEQLKNFATPGDLLLAISGSGDSPNILRAITTAKDRGLTVIGLTGFSGGKAKPMCEICLVVPSQNMQIIEDVHLSITHSLYHILSHRIEGQREIGRAVGAD
jgi:D-sedoheptulose 7-phosphate isomerase